MASQDSYRVAHDTNRTGALEEACNLTHPDGNHEFFPIVQPDVQIISITVDVIKGKGVQKFIPWEGFTTT